MSTKTNGSAALAGTRPSLYWTESKLGAAIARLDAVDPDEQMSNEEASDFIAQFVNPEAVEARRDEFATFILEAEAFADAKLTMADAIAAQAQRILKGVARMRDEATKVMKAAGVKALSGATYTIKLKDSPGSVAVDDEAQVPPEFFRTKEDADLLAIKRLAGVVVMLTRQALEDAGMKDDALDAAVKADEFVVEAKMLVENAVSSRRAIDKKLIQAEWKANGETRETVDPETGECVNVPLIPGVHKQVDTKLVIA